MLKDHELFVHFPVALFLSALVFSLIGIFYKRKLFKEIVFWNLTIGVLTASMAIYTGLLEQETIKTVPLKEVLELHRRNAYTLAALFLILVLWMGLRKRRMKIREYLAWLSIMVVASASVVYQGLLGHEMSSKKQEMETRIKKPIIKKEMDYGWNF